MLAQICDLPELLYCCDLMTRVEFEQLRDLPDKKITQNVCFSTKKSARPLYLLEPVAVENSLGIDLHLSGTFNPVAERVSFNFFVRGVGPICRFCINGRDHPGAGRTHKHDLFEESDPSNNLPRAKTRSDLSIKDLTTAWRAICTQAKIEHVGELQIPGAA